MKKNIILGFIIFICTASFFSVDAKLWDFWKGIYHSFSSVFHIDSDTQAVYVSLPDDVTTTFTLDADFTYSSQAYPELTLEFSGDIYTVTNTKNGFQYIFSKEKEQLTQINYWEKSLYVSYLQNGNIFYVTDKINNTIYFEYDKDSGYISTMSDVYKSRILFDYSQAAWSYVLSGIKYNDVDIPLLYDAEWNIVLENSELQFSFTSYRDIPVVFSVDKESFITNPEERSIQYKRFQNTLYSFTKWQIYKIDQGKRNKIFDGDVVIDDIYVTSEWTLYYRVWYSLYKYIAWEKRSVHIYTSEDDISQFVVDKKWENIYFIKTLFPWYFVYQQKDKKLYSFEESVWYKGILLDGSTIDFLQGISQKIWEFHPEFAQKYEKWFQRLSKKIDTLWWSAEKKKKLAHMIDKRIMQVKNAESDVYKKEELLYILEQLKSLFN